MTDTLTHHHLAAEEVNDDSGPAIMLTQQEGIEGAHVVLVHPWQLRAVCEQFGIITSDPQTEKTIAMLTRRLHVLRDRVGHLAHFLASHSDSKHADLSYEQTYATATADIADEFCAELTDPPANPPPLPPIASPAMAKATASPQPSLI